ncbi:hypothetical protein HDG42_004380 [Paraburkholderia sp. JPY171]|nr:hypothetical protein [Paraburkholderia atlantica]MBB5418332.1 hypothetical protein [Paraburkholderia atlantica]
MKVAKSTLAREARRVTNGAVCLALNRVKCLVQSGAVRLVASNVVLR